MELQTMTHDQYMAELKKELRNCGLSTAVERKATEIMDIVKEASIGYLIFGDITELLCEIIDLTYLAEEKQA